MPIDVRAEVKVDRARTEVWRYATDPANDPAWIGGITRAEVLDGPASGVGALVSRTARFMGRTIEYVNEVVAHDPPARLEMRSVKGPFPMRVTYSFDQVGDATVVRVRVEGDAGRYYRWAGPLLAPMVRRSIAGDVRRLKGLLESRSSPG